MQSYKIEKINEDSDYKKICISKNKDVFVGMDKNGNLKVQSPERKNLTFKEECDDFMLSACGNILICINHFSFQKLKIKVFHLRKDFFIEINCDGCSLYSIKISPKGDLFYIKTYKKITFFTIDCIFLFEIFDNDIEIGDTNFSEDGNSFYFVTTKFIKIYDIQSRKLKHKIKKKNICSFNSSRKRYVKIFFSK
jgi:hypothetical protein